MESFALIGVFIKMRPIEESEAVFIGGKMRGDAVEDDADAVLVELVNEKHEILRSAVARGRRKIARGLVAPGAKKRVLHDGQELDVGVSHAFDVRDQFSGHFTVR